MKLSFLLRAGTNTETGEYLREPTQQKLLDAIPRLPTTHGWLVTVEEFHKRHSREQECTYWMWLHEIERFTGQDADDIHEYLKDKHLPKRAVTIGGHEAIVPTSSRKLSVSKYGDLMTHAQRLAAELGVTLTDPAPMEYA